MIKNLINRKRRTRVKIKSDLRPRLSVFRSNKEIYGQVIDEKNGNVLISYSSKQIKETKTKKLGKKEKAFVVGEKLAELAKKKKISKVVFDRSGYKYHGRVKSLADGARKGGLNF